MRFNVQFNQTSQTLDIKFKNHNKRFEMQFGEMYKVSVNQDAEYYSGEYEVTPSIEAQTLETANKLLTDDVNVKAIPYYEVSNIQGGKTIIIGG